MYTETKQNMARSRREKTDIKQKEEKGKTREKEKVKMK